MASAAAPAALADSYDDALATCGLGTLEQPFAGFGDTAYYTSLAAGSFVLSRGDSTTTAPACVTHNSPTIRFFARNNGVPGARLRVEALLKGANGKVHILPVATIAATTEWAPTDALALKLSAFTGMAKAAAVGVAFRFSAVNGTWRIDRLYLDPLKDC